MSLFVKTHLSELIKCKAEFKKRFRLVSHRGDTFSGAGQTHSTVTSQGHRVGVHWVNIWPAVGQFHRDQTSLVVGANSLVGLNVGRVHDRLLKIETTYYYILQNRLL